MPTNIIFNFDFIATNVSREASKVMICGTPKMNEAINAILIKQGFTDAQI